MKTIKTLSVASALVAVFFTTLPAHAQQPVTKPAQVKDIEAVTKVAKVTANVAAVDMKNRIVTLVGPEGNTFSVLAGPQVKNLAQVKVGDELVVEYFESVALDFQKGDGIRMATTFDNAVGAKPGQKPGAVALRTVTLVSNVWSVNQTKSTVLVRGPYGHFSEVKLKDPAMLGGVKVGDQMKITFTEAVAIGITKP